MADGEGLMKDSARTNATAAKPGNSHDDLDTDPYIPVGSNPPVPLRRGSSEPAIRVDEDGIPVPMLRKSSGSRHNVFTSGRMIQHQNTDPAYHSCDQADEDAKYPTISLRNFDPNSSVSSLVASAPSTTSSTSNRISPLAFPFNTTEVASTLRRSSLTGVNTRVSVLPVIMAGPSGDEDSKIMHPSEVLLPYPYWIV